MLYFVLHNHFLDLWQGNAIPISLLKQIYKTYNLLRPGKISISPLASNL